MIDAMKQALEALDTCHWDYDSEEESYKTFDEDLVNDASEALRQAIEQAETQEPVAWIQEDRIVPEIGYDCTMTREHPKELGYKPLYTAPQKYCPSENNAAYEKGFVEGMAKQMHSSVDRAVNAMTKPWVGLTDEEFADLWSWSMTYEAERFAPTQKHAFARAIEQRLKEKNI